MSPFSSIGGYEIILQLSCGGMADVFLARRSGSDGFEKFFAIKTIKADRQADPAVRALFIDEARVSARISSPSVAQVYDFGEDDGSLFLVMEYVEGVSLEHALRRKKKPWPPFAAAKLIIEACEGLHVAHELTDHDGRPLSVVHRDISPSNLLVTFDGHIKIIDFGIALVRDRQAPPTELGFRGKVRYASPEQLLAKPMDRRSDIFSLSMVLHEMLSGRAVFQSSNPGVICETLLRGQIPPPSSRLEYPLPPLFDDTVLKGLSKKPKDRHPDARTFARALERAADQCVVRANAREFLSDVLRAERQEQRRMLRQSLSIRVPPERRPKTVRLGTSPQETPRALARSAAAMATTRHLAAPAGRGWYFLFAAVVFCAGLGLAMVLGGHVLRPLKGEGSGPFAPASARVNSAAGAQPARRPTEALNSEGTASVPPPSNEDREVLVLPVPDSVPPGPPEPIAEAAKNAAMRSTTDSVAPGPPAPTADGKRTGKKSVRPSGRTGRRWRSRRASKKEAAVAMPSETAVPKAFGLLSVDAHPYALVEIDGKIVGTTPVLRYRVNAGPHTLRLLQPSSRKLRTRRSVSVQAGVHERIVVKP